MDRINSSAYSNILPFKRKIKSSKSSYRKYLETLSNQELLSEAKYLTNLESYSKENLLKGHETLEVIYLRYKVNNPDSQDPRFINIVESVRSVLEKHTFFDK